MPEGARAKAILKTRARALVLLAFVGALAISAHLIQPTSWSVLGMKTLNSLHGPGFAILALLILCYLQIQCRSVINYVLAAMIAMAVGVASEIAQIPGARDAEIKDLVVDALGIFGAIGVVASFDKSVRQLIPGWASLILPTTAAAALAVACIPTLWFTYALVQQHQHFPALLTFEHKWESAIYSHNYPHRQGKVATPQAWPTVGDNIFQGIESGRWGEFLSLHPYQDWRGYSALSFVAASGGEPFSLGLGLRDSGRNEDLEVNRFYTQISIGPDPQRFKIDFRELDAAAASGHFGISNIETVVFSADNPGNGQVLLLDDIRLEQ